MRIRGDLEGVVYVHAADGVVALAAGDTIPVGAEVGDHLIDREKESTGGSTGRTRGRGSASRASSDD